MSKGWKYGLIKVATAYEGDEYEEQINLLVELFPLGDNEEYNSFCNARLMSTEELNSAQKDIERDGINNWFYDNGIFEHETCSHCLDGQWDWTPNDELEKNKKTGMTTLKESNKGQTYFELASGVLNQMGWSEGDDIEFDMKKDGTFTMKKVKSEGEKAMEKAIKEYDYSYINEYELYQTYGGD
jgi:hypothetical protein